MVEYDRPHSVRTSSKYLRATAWVTSRGITSSVLRQARTSASARRWAAFVLSFKSEAARYLACVALIVSAALVAALKYLRAVSVPDACSSSSAASAAMSVKTSTLSASSIGLFNGAADLCRICEVQGDRLSEAGYLASLQRVKLLLDVSHHSMFPYACFGLVVSLQRAADVRVAYFFSK
jgi:hypothetical protein